MVPDSTGQRDYENGYIGMSSIATRQQTRDQHVIIGEKPWNLQITALGISQQWKPWAFTLRYYLVSTMKPSDYSLGYITTMKAVGIYFEVLFSFERNISVLFSLFD